MGRMTGLSEQDGARRKLLFDELVSIIRVMDSWNNRVDADHPSLFLLFLLLIHCNKFTNAVLLNHYYSFNYFPNAIERSKLRNHIYSNHEQEPCNN